MQTKALWVRITVQLKHKLSGHILKIFFPVLIFHESSFETLESTHQNSNNFLDSCTVHSEYMLIDVFSIFPIFYQTQVVF